MAWIDIPMQEMFGYNPPHLHRVYPPDVVVNDPHFRKWYNKELCKALAKKGMLTKTRKLRQIVEDNLSGDPAKYTSLVEVDALHLEISNTR